MLDEQGKDRNSTKSKVDEIFLKIDTNGDGKLSKEEFITGCLRDDYLLRLFAPGAS
jgi:Ca2+-binding EF-hand superfamily protein